MVNIGLFFSRKAFAERRDSSLSSMHIMDVTNDEEMRRRFRNYEI